MKKICIKCGKETVNSQDNYCSSCGGKIIEERKDFIKSKCRICGKPIYVHIKATHHFCDYHWSVFDANDGW
jgi:ribosomal protein L37E